MNRARLALACSLVLTVTALPGPAGAVTLEVPAAVETAPVASTGDAADDMAIWRHPVNPALSTVIGTNKRGALEVYDLAGQRLQRITGITPNNVDLRPGFPLGAASVDVAAISDAGTGTLRFYTVDPSTRLLSHVSARTIRTGIGASGLCMYRAGASGKFYAFVTGGGGRMSQWELVASGSRIDAVRVRGPWDVGGASEGCVADDDRRVLYVAEQDVGIWRYGAGPTESTTVRTLVDATGSGHLTADVEGLTLASPPGAPARLLASSQGNSTFAVYAADGDNVYVKSFRVVRGPTADGCSGTDGIAALAADLGPSFPHGLFACQDGRNTTPGSSGNQNFKFVRLELLL